MATSSSGGISQVLDELMGIVEKIKETGELIKDIPDRLKKALPESGEGPASNRAALVGLKETANGLFEAVLGGEDSGGIFGDFAKILGGKFETFFSSMKEKLGGAFSTIFGGEGDGLFGAFGSLLDGNLDGLFGALNDQFGGIFSSGKEEGSSDQKAAAEGEKSVNEADDAIVKNKEKQDAARVESDKKAWNGLISNALAGSKLLQKIQKVTAIASVLKNIPVLLTEAAKAAPPPFNVPLIAAAAAFGAKQLSAVKGQMHDGLDKVPSTGTYLLEKGERVVDRRLNRDLSDYLRLQGGGGTVNTRESTVNNSPSVSLTINGNASADAVESNRGALEGMIRDIFADYALEAPF